MCYPLRAGNEYNQNGLRASLAFPVKSVSKWWDNFTKCISFLSGYRIHTYLKELTCDEEFSSVQECSAHEKVDSTLASEVCSLKEAVQLLTPLLT